MAVRKNNISKLFTGTRAIVMDIDGTLTDGHLEIMQNGREIRNLHIHDSYAIEQAVKYLKVGIITGENPKGMIRKLRSLGIENIMTNEREKGKAIRRMAKDLQLDIATMLYIGDDVLDIPPLKLCGFPCCPKDAYSGVRAVSIYISPYTGGHGCVRDIIEQVLKLKGKWKEG